MAGSAVLETLESQQPPSRVETRRYNVARSCVRCHQRKIRCNKLTPCSSCLKSGNMGSCRYPGPERIKRRSRNQLSMALTQEAEIPEQTVSHNFKQDTHANKYFQMSRDFLSSSEYKSGDGGLSRDSSNFTGLLIRGGNLVRYVNDHVLSNILEKEEGIRSAITSPHISSNGETLGLETRPLSLLHPISLPMGVKDSEGLLPPRRRAIQLWQVFILNVDPIIKLLHIPTIQSIVYAAINEPHTVTPDLRALLFAIYFSALTSTLRGNLGFSNEDRQPELEQFKRGLEKNLSQGNFLDQPNMYSLQAMAIFIGAFRCFGSGRSIWTLNGTVIRVAQLMGIHRDGQLFHLSPFDQEMRRRLWWKIITADSRTLEDQGVWITGNRYLGDSRMPLNIDDRDIGPHTESMPVERTGFTEMTPLVAICHIQVAGEAVGQLSLCGDLESYSKKLPTARETIAQTRRKLDESLFCNYDPNIPIQKIFKTGTKMVLDKIEWRCQEGLLRHQLQSNLCRSRELDKVSTESDQLFTRACELLGVSLELMTNEIYASFLWHNSSYLPYELLTFVLWRLYITPTGPSVDEAWQIVSRTFSVIEEASILPDKGPRWSILCKLKEKVAGQRATSPDGAEAISSVSGNHLHHDAGIGSDISEQENGGTISLNEKTWDSEGLLFSTDWVTFQQNLNIDGIMWPQF